MNNLINKIGNKRVITLLSGKQLTGSISNTYKYLIKNSSNGYIRRWALEQYLLANREAINNNKNIAFLVKLLADKNWYVQKILTETLINIGSSSIPILDKYLKDTTHSLNLRYLAAYSILRLGGDISTAMETVKNIKIPMPSYISKEMREVIIRSWVPEAEPRTDFRWLIEYELLTKLNPNTKTNRTAYDYDIPELSYNRGKLNKDTVKIQVNIINMVDALKKKGIKVLELVDYAKEMGSGSSTVYLIKMQPDSIKIKGKGSEKTVITQSDWLHISTLAPYIYYSRVEKEMDAENSTDSLGLTEIDKSRQKNYEHYQAVAKEFGFTWLSEQQRQYKVPRLNIYFFGRRESLLIEDLLFYWQD